MNFIYGQLKQSDTKNVITWELEIVLLSERNTDFAEAYLRFVASVFKVQSINMEQKNILFQFRPVFSNLFLSRFGNYIGWMCGNKSNNVSFHKTSSYI